MTLKGTPLIVTPTGVAGLTFLDEAATANAYAAILKKQGVNAIVLLIHQGGQQSTSGADVNGCTELQRRRARRSSTQLVARRSRSSSRRTRTSRTTARSTAISLTSASSFGRMITTVNLTIDSAHRHDHRRPRRDNEIVTRDVPKDPAQTAIIAKYKAMSDADREPRRRLDHGRTSRARRTPGRVGARRRDRRRPARRDRAPTTRRRGRRVHEPGRHPRRPRRDQQSAARRRPGHLRRALHRPAVRERADGR